MTHNNIVLSHTSIIPTARDLVNAIAALSVQRNTSYCLHACSAGYACIEHVTGTPVTPYYQRVEELYNALHVLLER